MAEEGAGAVVVAGRRDSLGRALADELRLRGAESLFVTMCCVLMVDFLRRDSRQACWPQRRRLPAAARSRVALSRDLLRILVSRAPVKEAEPSLNMSPAHGFPRSKSDHADIMFTRGSRLPPRQRMSGNPPPWLNRRGGRLGAECLRRRGEGVARDKATSRQTRLRASLSLRSACDPWAIRRRSTS